MPELPEVEILARHLRPLIRGKTIRGVAVRRAKVLAPTSPRKFRRALLGAKFAGLSRRGKYLLFRLRPKAGDPPVTLLGHLGMTGRIYLARKKERLPRHAAVVLDLGRENFIYEDTRYFGRLTLDLSAVKKLGPEPLAGSFDQTAFGRSLKRSRQAIKVRLLDQTLVAGIGNIYASEALFRARISPRWPACRLTAVAGRAALAGDTENVGRGHCAGQHRAVEFWRETLGRIVLFWPGARRNGLLRGTIKGLRPRGKALSPLRRLDPAHPAGRAEHLLLPALPEGVTNRFDATFTGLLILCPLDSRVAQW